MKFLISGLRTLILAVVALLLMLFLTLSQGWHTPLVNHFAAPYKVYVGHTELNWFPLALEVEDLTVGEGEGALTLERIHVRSGLGFITGKPVELYVQLDNGHIAYQGLTATQSGVDGLQGQKTSDWQVAGLSLTQWQQLFASQETAEPDTESEAAESEQKAPWAIHLQSLQISNFKAESLQNGLPDLQLNRLLFGPFYTDQPEKRSSLQVELTTAGGLVDLKGALSPLSTAPKVSIDAVIKDFSPNHDWLAQVPEELSAVLNTQLKLDVALSESKLEPESGSETQRLMATLGGDLQLNQVQWQPDAEPTTQDVYGFETLNLSKLNLQVEIADLNQAEPKAQLAFEQLDINGLDVRQPDLSYQLQTILLKQLQVTADKQTANIESGLIEIAQGVMDYRLAKSADDQKPSEENTPEPEQQTSAPESEQAQSGEADSLQTEEKIEPYQIRFAGESIRLKKHEITYRDLNLEDAPLTQIELTDIELNQPRYPAIEPFPWLADIWLNGQSHWLVNGDLQTAPLKVNIKIEQSGLNLPDISPYSEHYAEVVFVEGNMDNKIQFEFTPNSLKGSLGFDFTHLDMSLKGSQKSLNLPLQTAFSLLEDSDSRIELSIDLDKKGEDLKVGTSAIVKELLLAASQKGAVAYLKYALQPYGALLTLKDVGSSLLKSGSLPLEAVVLDPLQDTFTTDQIGYAQKVSGILKEKEEFKLNYCYLPAEAERNLLVKQLGDAAKADAALKELNQKRLTLWRKLFAGEGLASRMKQCTQDELKKQRKKLKAAEQQQSRFTLLLKP
ncbi:DUF748 domain-containing protein [Oceanospirillum sanctuarii]|uniref:DUF748 domain-containing protein n=1 Tax=Oceanospirillum sanctuarii TaxID=1434821 RepID=UPI000A38C33B|nr:DUF748 domain-containing protein [Oceanospirillum sanctuarii]